MGSWWSYEEITEDNIKDKEEWQKDADEVEKELKNEIHKLDVIEELKNNPIFNERRNRSKSSET